MSELTAADEEFWTNRWEIGKIGWKSLEEHKPWEQGMGLVADGGLEVKKGESVFVPLSGDTPAIEWFFDEGYSVVAADLSKIAIGAFVEASGKEFENVDGGFNFKEDEKEIDLKIGNVLKLDLDGKEFGLIYDHAAYMAMEPSQRQEYFDVMDGHLKVGGVWIVTLAHREDSKGPPFCFENGIKEYLDEEHYKFVSEVEFPVVEGKPFTTSQAVFQKFK